MKKLTFFLAIFISVTFTANAQWHPQNNKSTGSNPDNSVNPAHWKKTAQQFSAAKSGKHDLSGPKSLVWKWDTIISYDTLGLVNYRYIQVFDINGNVLTMTREQWQSGTWNNYGRYTYTYDVYGNMLTELWESWSGSAWENALKSTYTYDLNGYLLTAIEASWQTGTWENEYRYTYTYDGGGHQLTYLYENWATNTWEAAYRETYTYDGNGNCLNSLSEEWQTNTWVNSERSTRSYDGSGNMLSILNETWQTSTWENSERSTMTYDGSGNRLTYLYEYWTTAWENNEKSTYTYDGNGNMLTQIVELWQTTIWEYFEKYTYTHDTYGNSITGKHESWTGSNWEPSIYYIPFYSQKEIIFWVDDVYRYEANFISFNSPTEVENLNVENIVFNIFPNPTSDIVTININHADNADLNFTIYNIVGELVMSETIQQNMHQINIADLSNGIYVVEIKSKDWTEKQKLIIQR